jgi:hypothetical protein
MKAIKINTSVNLTSGLSIPSGSIVVIAEGYADVKSTKDGFIPSQIATLVFASEQSIAEGKSPITDIADFNPVFSSLQLSITDYATLSAESLLINAVFNALVAVYGAGNVEQVEI